VAEYEVLESHPGGRPGPSRRWWVAGALALLAVAVGAVVLRPDAPAVAECREERGASWCAEPSQELTDARLVRLVRNYCPRLRDLPLHRVVPQPLHLLDLAPRRGDLVRRTGGPTGTTESALLGQPDRLAWLVRRDGGNGPFALQVTCTGTNGRVPALVLDRGQLEAGLEATTGGVALDLRAAARTAARTFHGDTGRDVSLGIFRCRTGRAALDRQPGARFTCELQVFSELGQGGYRLSYRVDARAPYLRMDQT